LAGEIEEIRARINIVDLVSQRVQLKKTGKNYQGLCPFHDDKRPSFTVNPVVGRYRCWSCGETGDIFNWVMKTQNVPFAEALQLLAAQAGVELTNRPNPQERSERALHLEIMEEALKFFREQLSKSSTAQDYLTRRGIDESTIAEWELGYAPDVGEALAVHLRKKAYALSVCRSLFLVEEDASGGYYDKFRGRLMFPIRDERGDLVAFGGRVLGDGVPKYINSSDTPVYRKSRVLYGLNRALGHISRMKPRQAVLCEGYLDVIACHRAGVKGAVASLGTALSEDHAKLLARWSDEVVILYDADAAGQKAAERAIEVLRPEKVQLRVALMPPGEDPDTLLRSQGPVAIENAVKGATLPTEFKLDQVIASHAEKGQAFWAAVVDVIAQASHIAEMERHIERVVSQYSGVEDQLYLRESIRKQVLTRRRSTKQSMQEEYRPVPAIQFTVSALQPAEATLIACLPTRHLRVIAHEALSLPELFLSEVGRAFSGEYARIFEDNPPEGEISVWLSRLSEPMQDLVDQCVSDPRFSQLDERFVKDSVGKLEKELQKRRLQFIKKGADSDRLKQIEQTLRKLKGERDSN